PDYWFHLAAGRWIARHGLPATDPWCLAARGQVTGGSEWLFHWLLFQVHAVGGDVAVALWRAAWAAASMGPVLAIGRRRGGLGWTLLMAWPLALAVPRERMVAGAEQPAMVLLLAFLLCLELRREGRGPGLFLLVPLQVLWANLHPSWVLGPLLALVYS